MSLLIIISVLVGALFGYLVVPPEWGQILDQATTVALAILLFNVGIDLGRNRKAWAQIKQLGWHVLILPLSVAVGSIGASILVGKSINLPLNQAAAVGAGFGWYSLSGVLIAKLQSAQAGALAFLTNVFRELLAILSIPFLAKHVGKLSCIAPGGATTMDTTLPLIAREAGPELAPVAFLNGAVLSALVPLLVPLLLQFSFS